MMAPKFERGHMLGAAIHEASHQLSEPIDRIEVVSNEVVVEQVDRSLL